MNRRIQNGVVLLLSVLFLVSCAQTGFHGATVRTHVYDSFENIENVPNGYGHYSYVLTFNLSDETVERLAIFIRHLIVDKKVFPALEDADSSANIFLFPVKNQAKAREFFRTWSLRPEQEKLIAFIKDNYEVEEYKDKLRRVCAQLDSNGNDFCAGDGPIIISKTNPFDDHKSDDVYYRGLNLGVVKKPEFIPNILNAYMAEKEGAKKYFFGQVSQTAFYTGLGNVLNSLNKPGEIIASLGGLLAEAAVKEVVDKAI